MTKNKTLAERGKFKMKIQTALYKSQNIRELILGEDTISNSKDLKSEFKKYVKSHLFIDDTIQEANTFIYYDISLPYLNTNTKTCKIIMYLITHRDMLEDYYIEGYYGDRIDILAQMVEETLLDEEIIQDFGIGELTLDSVEPYNSVRFYGCSMVFSVPTFR